MFLLGHAQCYTLTDLQYLQMTSLSEQPTTCHAQTVPCVMLQPVYIEAAARVAANQEGAALK